MDDNFPDSRSKRKRNDARDSSHGDGKKHRSKVFEGEGDDRSKNRDRESHESGFRKERGEERERKREKNVDADEDGGRDRERERERESSHRRHSDRKGGELSNRRMEEDDGKRGGKERRERGRVEEEDGNREGKERRERRKVEEEDGNREEKERRERGKERNRSENGGKEDFTDGDRREELQKKVRESFDGKGVRKGEEREGKKGRESQELREGKGGRKLEEVEGADGREDRGERDKRDKKSSRSLEERAERREREEENVEKGVGRRHREEDKGERGSGEGDRGKEEERKPGTDGEGTIVKGLEEGEKNVKEVKREEDQNVENKVHEKIEEVKVKEEEATNNNIGIEEGRDKRKERDEDERKVTKRRRWDQNEEKKEKVEDVDVKGLEKGSGVNGEVGNSLGSVNGVEDHVAKVVPPASIVSPSITPPTTQISAEPPTTTTTTPPSGTLISTPGQEKVKPALNLQALAKARKALEMQKKLNERLAKLPQLNKSGAGTSTTTKTSLPTSSPSPSPSVAPPSTSSPLSVATISSGILPTPPLPQPGLSLGASGSLLPGGNTISSSQLPSQIPSQIPPSGVSPQLGAPFPGFMPGLLPSLMQNLMPGFPGMTPGMLPSLDVMLKAQAMAQQMGFSQANLLSGVRGSIGSIGAVNSSMEPKPEKPPVLRLDAHGREIDESGKVLERGKQGPISTLKVNINKAKKEAFKILRPELEEDPIDSPFYDERMGSNKTKLIRARKPSLNFVEEGEMIRQAEMQRLRAQVGEARMVEMRARQAAFSRAKAEQGREENPNMIAVAERAPVEQKKPKDPIPDTEWWDVPILANGKYSVDIVDGKANVKNGKITIYVEHPVPIEPPAEPPLPPPQPLKLTKKEQKKLRTQRRLAREKERQEMIRQGLLEPPKPKVKMSNLMKVLGAEATQDPTRMEQQVKSAAAEREQAHVDRNLARKLTPEERREKKDRKLFDDSTSVETVVSVYRLVHLVHPQTRFKVDINVQENRMTGRCIMTDDMTMVMVEGGTKSSKRFKKLMLQRIKWGMAVVEEKEGDPKSILGARPNDCKLVWEGAVSSPSFEDFQIEEFRTSLTAKKFLEERDCGHYWDLAMKFPAE